MNPQETNNLLSGLMHGPRRSFLGMATAAVAGWLALLQPVRANDFAVAAQASTVAPELEGTWLETVTFQGTNLPPPIQKPFPTLITYARGGGLITITGNTGPTIGNISFGTWTKTGPRQFAFTFLGMFYDDKGVLERYVKARETLRFGADPDAYDGVATVQQLDTKFAGLGQFNATTHATRIRAES